MNKIILATGNKDKAQEIKALLDDQFEVVTMVEAGIDVDIIENGETFEDNALIKVHAIKPLIEDSDRGCILMADDSGLCVDALDGAPGVFSARYAGENVSYADNNVKLLKELQGIDAADRTAQFICSVAVIFPNGKEKTYRGVVNGHIAESYTGEEGFGYDPLFILDETGETYAQMNADQKNACSHRYKAVKAATKDLLAVKEREEA